MMHMRTRMNEIESEDEQIFLTIIIIEEESKWQKKNNLALVD